MILLESSLFGIVALLIYWIIVNIALSLTEKNIVKKMKKKGGIEEQDISTPFRHVNTTISIVVIIIIVTGCLGYAPTENSPSINDTVIDETSIEPTTKGIGKLNEKIIRLKERVKHEEDKINALETIKESIKVFQEIDGETE